MAMQTEHVVCSHLNFEGFGTRPALKLGMTDSGVPQLQFTKETTSGVFVKQNSLTHILFVILFS